MTFIKKINIRRYGKFENKTIEFGPGLNVIKGDNEAGKTTLQTFTFQMLTGFPTRHVKSDVKYFPSEGDPSGSMLLSSNGKETSIERIGRKHNKERGPGLDAVLHGVDDVLLKGVYRIEHADIQKFGLLNNDEQRDRVFSAGIVGAGTSARQAIGALEEKAQKLGGVGKRKGAILNLLGEVDEVEARLFDAKQEMEAYPHRLMDVQSRDRALETLGAETKRKNSVVLRSKRLIKAYSEYNEWQSNLACLHESDHASVSKAQAESARRMQETIERLEGELETLESGIASTRSELFTIRLNDAVWSRQSELKRLQSSLSGYNERNQQHQKLVKTMSEIDTQIENHKQVLGHGWPKYADLAVTVSFLSELEEKGHRVERAQKQAEEASTALGQANLTLEQAQKELPPKPEPIESGLPQLETIDSVEELLSAWQQTEVELAQIAPVPQANIKLWFGIAALCAIVSVVTGLLGYVGFAILALLVAFASAGVGVVKWRSIERLRSGHERAKEAIHTRRDGIRDAAKSPCEELDLTWPVTTSQLRVKRRQGAEALRLSATRTHEVQAHEAGLTRVRAAVSDLEAAQLSIDVATGELAQAESDWSAWLAEHGLPTATPSTTQKLVTEIRNFQSTQDNYAKLSRECDGLFASLEAWRSEVLEVLRSAGMDDGVDIVVALQLTTESLESEQGVRKEYEKLSAELSRQDGQLAKVRESLQNAQTELQALLAAVNATSISELLEMRTITQQRAELKQAIANSEKLVRSHIGHGASSEADLEALAIGNVAEWEHQAAEAEARLQELEELKEAEIEARKEAKTEIDRLLASTEIPALELKLDGLKTELRKAVREWQTLTLASQMIGSALQKYRTERQPDVLRDATRFYSQATLGEYDAIQLDDETDQVVVRDAHTGECWDVANLSSGTEEPLYLSIRLGLAAEFSRNRGSLPIMMDDVLVNLDSNRRKAMIRAIADFAKEQQVLFFTCHDHVLAEFKAISNATVIEMDKSEARKGQDAA